VPTLRLGRTTLKSVEASPATIAAHDCVIILTDHSVYDVPSIVEAANLVIDTRNATKNLHAFKDRIIKLGAGSNPSRPAHYDDHEPSVEVTTH
jgi:UDP-N-acetyl-D-glucosamine dehydrogenase